VEGEPDQTSRYGKQHVGINLWARPEIPVKADKQEQVKGCQASNKERVGIHFFGATNIPPQWRRTEDAGHATGMQCRRQLQAIRYAMPSPS
jgi:hypothetical protein